MHVHVSFLYHSWSFFADNEIDGYEFKELTIEDLSRMIKPVGIMKKIKRIVEKVSHACNYISVMQWRFSVQSRNCKMNGWPSQQVSGVKDIIETAHLKARGNFDPSSSSSAPSTLTVSSAGLSASATPLNPEMKGFPRPFPLPLKWSDPTSMAILSGKMTPFARKEITQACVTLMMVYEQKPSRRQCIDVAKIWCKNIHRYWPYWGTSCKNALNLFKLLHGDHAYCRDLGLRRLFSE